MRKEYIKISKFLSYILRHHPEKVGINLDSEGFTDINHVLEILNNRYNNLNIGKITQQTIIDIISQSDKQRFDIKDDKIRAFYGHSLDEMIKMGEAKVLPKKLFHGTTLKAWMAIQEEGLKSKGRQYVHLSEDIRTAEFVGKRRTSDPIILEIDVDAAISDGIRFFKSGDMYLADFLDPKYIHRL